MSRRLTAEGRCIVRWAIVGVAFIAVTILIFSTGRYGPAPGYGPEFLPPGEVR